MITKPKGTNDLQGVESKLYLRMQGVLDNYANVYNYKYVRTPIFESAELFKRSVGESSDIVQKETYDFTDRSNRVMTLRPEGTAGIVRNFIEEKKYGDVINPVKNYYLGTMYRYERPGQGRYREFTQFGAESLGSDDPLMDAEIISMSVNILRDLGIDASVRINNLGSSEDRDNYKEALVKYLEPRINELCEDCQNRLKTNPLRILDCKFDKDNEILKNTPNILEYQSTESEDRFKKVLSYLDYLDIDYEVDEKLVRGLDYYDYMVYELYLNDSLALGGGGRYNHLVKELGGPDTPCVGFACGVERVLSIMKEKHNELDQVDVYIMAVNEEEKLKANILMQDLRLNNISVETDYLNRSFKAQFKDADRHNAKQLIILNSDDLNKGLINVKDNLTKEEKKVDENEIVDYILGVI